jgi:hypothetical protein
MDQRLSTNCTTFALLAFGTQQRVKKLECMYIYCLYAAVKHYLQEFFLFELECSCDSLLARNCYCCCSTPATVVCSK